MENNEFYISISYTTENRKKVIILSEAEYFDDLDPGEVYEVYSTPRFLNLEEYVDIEASKIKTIDLLINNRTKQELLTFKKIRWLDINWFTSHRIIQKNVTVYSEYMVELFEVNGKGSQVIKVDEEDTLKLISHSLILDEDTVIGVKPRGSEY